MYASLGQKVVSKTYYLHTDFPMYSLKKLVVLAVAVVMVNPAGKLRVTYIGHPSTTAEPSSPCKSLPSRFPNNVIFIPYGITTNSLTLVLPLLPGDHLVSQHYNRQRESDPDSRP